MGHKDPGGIYWPLAHQRYLYFVLQHPQAVFLTESNTQPSSIFLLKRMSYICFLISTYSFTSSYTCTLYWKHIKFPFHIYILIFVVFPTQRWFFYHWFSLKPTQLSHVLFAYKNKTIFLANQWVLKKMFIISGLQQFGLHRNMQNKVELFDRGPGQKMGCNKLLKN